MDKKIDKSAKQQIRNLLLVVGSATLFAFLFSALFLYKYGPTGQVDIKNALISPDFLKDLNFNETNTKTGGQSRFIFDKIQFEYFDVQKGVRENISLSTDAYRAFYDEVKSDISLMEVSDEIKNSFNKGHLAKLKILVRTESSASFQYLEKVFQEIDFSSKGGFFRVHLRDSEKNYSNDAYYQHEGIYQKAMTIFSRGY